MAEPNSEQGRPPTLISRSALLQRLASSVPLIAPSLLKCDFGNLAEVIRRLESAGARHLHWDVMDGHFVPNLTYGPPVIEGLRDRTELPFEAHLMISEPARYLDDYLKAGCNSIIFHIEAVPQPKALLERIKSSDAVAGVAINPETPVERLGPALDHLDFVLVMSVEPGFGGQKFMPAVLSKVRWLRSRLPAGRFVSIDGGIDTTTIAEAAEAGSQIFAVGSAVMDEDDYGRAIRELTAHAKAHLAPKGATH
jgi:ribulose-phosphate 3-epimerase